jgi:hypothetical protein
VNVNGIDVCEKVKLTQTANDDDVLMNGDAKTFFWVEVTGGNDENDCWNDDGDVPFFVETLLNCYWPKSLMRAED